MLSFSILSLTALISSVWIVMSPPMTPGSPPRAGAGGPGHGAWSRPADRPVTLQARHARAGAQKSRNGHGSAGRTDARRASYSSRERVILGIGGAPSSRWRKEIRGPCGRSAPGDVRPDAPAGPSEGMSPPASGEPPMGFAGQAFYPPTRHGRKPMPRTRPMPGPARQRGAGVRIPPIHLLEKGVPSMNPTRQAVTEKESHLAQDLLEELEREARTTRRVLERVPEDRLAWRPHERARSLGELAMHVAVVPGAVAELIASASPAQ